MISIMILILVKVYGKEKIGTWIHFLKKTFLKRLYIFFLLQVLTLLLTSSNVLAQLLNFKVVQNNTRIGWIQLRKTDSASYSSIELNSEIKKRVVFVVSVVEKQRVLFNDGVMIKSYVYRRVNDNIKMNKHTVFTGNHYEVNSEDLSERISIQRIHYNQLSLYFKEPVNIEKVYSDSYQRFLFIVKVAESVYKIEMPDGNINYYYYRNGVCTRIKVEHSLFTVDFIRV